jgi:signal transduction histidine kinase
MPKADISETSKTSRWAPVKSFLSVFLPFTALIIGVSILLYYVQVKGERVVVELRQKNSVALAEAAIADEFDSLVSDLMILSKNKHLQMFLQTGEHASLEALAEEFLSYSENKRLYDQVRFLDDAGMEMVRVNFNNGEPDIVPENQLQKKGRRYYFSDVFQIDRGEIFVSPFDLNIESGQIEMPLKPMIRFGTPVFDANGQKRGIVLLNYLGTELINDLKGITTVEPGQLALLNSEGFWLKGPKPGDEWGFMYEDGGNRKFGKNFPEAWQRIRKADHGQFRSVEGMFTFTTLYPLEQAYRSSTGSGSAFVPSDARVTGRDYYWKLVSHVPPDLLDAASREVLGKLVILDLFAIVILAMVSWFLARANIHRKRTEQELRNNEADMRAFMENAIGFGVYSVTLADDQPYGTRTSFASPSIKEILGIENPEDNASWFAHIHPEDLDRVTSAHHASRKTGQAFDETFRIHHPGKRELRWIHTVSSPVKFPGEKELFTHFNGMVVDVTNIKRSEQALRESEKKLARSKKMESLGLLAGGVAHDLNNILSGIITYPELLLMDLPEDSPLRRPLKTIQESGMRAADVVGDLLTIARGVAIGQEALNLNAIVSEYLESPEYRELEKTHSFVDFKAELDPNLLNMGGSPTHIKKILMNLAINAAEAVEVSGTVTITTLNRYLDEPLKGYEDVRTGEYVMLTVSDDGSGISPEDFERIFEPFYTKKIMGRSGTGLGLAIVWNTVQDHEGYINVKSSEKGTVFELYFPVTRDEVADEKEALPLKDYLGHGERILVVDDEERQREIAEALLTKLGYVAEAVESGEEAVRYVREHPVDLIVLDMVMPKGINGAETYEKIVKIRPRQKAVIASGYAKTKEVDAAQALGAGEYIKKPYTLEKIGVAVREELEK